MNNIKQIEGNRWIAKCNPQQLISTLLLPGTHDTMTADCQLRYYRTQHLSLAEQLNIGVRFLDIRLRKEMLAAHREWISDITAVQIFEICQQFLQQNPSEFIIMRIQNANEKKDDYEQYGEALHREIMGFNDLFYRWNKDESGRFILPTIAQATGKVLALECSPPELNFYHFSQDFWAMPWHQNNALLLQDLWDGPSIEQKKAAILSLLETSTAVENQLLLNHISATNGELGFPDAYAEQLNPFTANYWQNANKSPLQGVQIYDFITEELSKQIIQLNF